MATTEELLLAKKLREAKAAPNAPFQGGIQNRPSGAESMRGKVLVSPASPSEAMRAAPVAAGAPFRGGLSANPSEAQAMRSAPAMQSPSVRGSLDLRAAAPAQGVPFRGGFNGNPTNAEFLRGAPVQAGPAAPVQAAPVVKPAPVQAAQVQPAAVAPAAQVARAPIAPAAVPAASPGGIPAWTARPSGAGAPPPITAPAAPALSSTGLPTYPVNQPRATLPKVAPTASTSGINPNTAPVGTVPTASTLPWYSKPVGTGAATAVKNTAAAVPGKLSGAAKFAGKAAPVIAGGIEAARVVNDNTTPGMTALDQTGRVAEGFGRFGSTMAGVAGGAKAGAALGALGGPAAPVTVPVGAVLGGMAGGLVGDKIPAWTNDAINWLAGTQTQLPSQKAAELQAAQAPKLAPVPENQPPSQPVAQQPAQVAAAPTVPTTEDGAAQPKQPAMNGYNGGSREGANAESIRIMQSELQNPNLSAQDRAAVGREIARLQQQSGQPGGMPVNAAYRRAPTRTDAPQTAQPAAPEAVQATDALVAPAMQGVEFTAIGGLQDYAGNMMAQMNDGSIKQGDEARAIINATDQYAQANPLPQTPVEVIRPNAGTVGKDGRVTPGMGFNATMATPELGYVNEMDSATYNALAAQPGGLAPYVQAVAQGGIDTQSPYDAKARGALQEQELQNEGSARSAAISAGPSYANVAQDAEAAAARLAFEQEQAALPTYQPGTKITNQLEGTTSITPGAWVDRKNKTIQSVEPETADPTLPPGMVKKLGKDPKTGRPVYEDKNGKKFLGDK
jgi:hypothetical protein